LAPPPDSSSSPSPLSPSGRRRRFSASYKLRILREADACEPGQLAALLRQEGLYSSHLTKWREQRRQHGELGMSTTARGPKSCLDPKDERIAALEAQLRKAQGETALLRQLIDLQKKVSEILGVELPTSATL
jgi:transposase-like protein